MSMIIVFGLFLGMMFLVSQPTFAQINIGDKFTLGEEGTGIGDASNTQFQSVGGFIQVILPNVMVVANLILFFLILFGGFTMVANGGNPDKQQQGAKVLTMSLVGFLIIFGAYWLIGILGYITGFDILDPTSGVAPQ